MQAIDCASTETQGRQPGENIALDEVNRAPGGRVALIADGDRLDQQHTVWLEQGAAFFKVGVKIPVPDGFDHFYRYQFIVLAGEFPVIAKQHFNLLRQARLRDALPGQFVLLRDIVVVVTRQP